MYWLTQYRYPNALADSKSPNESSNRNQSINQSISIFYSGLSNKNF